jgi:hypothetical protein
MASTIAPDIRLEVLPRDYLAAIETDGQRWEDRNSRRRPAWADRPVWCLLQGTEERTFWRMKAFDGERDYFQRTQTATTAVVASLIPGMSFRTARELEDVACQLLVEQLGRALSPYEHSRVITSARELWRIASGRDFETLELTYSAGHNTVQECVA